MNETNDAKNPSNMSFDWDRYESVGNDLSGIIRDIHDFRMKDERRTQLLDERSLPEAFIMSADPRDEAVYTAAMEGAIVNLRVQAQLHANECNRRMRVIAEDFRSMVADFGRESVYANGIERAASMWRERTRGLFRGVELAHMYLHLNERLRSDANLMMNRAETYQDEVMDTVGHWRQFDADASAKPSDDRVKSLAEVWNKHAHIGLKHAEQQVVLAKAFETCLMTYIAAFGLKESNVIEVDTLANAVRSVAIGGQSELAFVKKLRNGVTYSEIGAPSFMGPRV